MMVGFWKSNVSIMLKGQNILFFIYCILCLKDGVNFSFATSTNILSSVFPTVTYVLPRAFVRGITSKASPLPTVSSSGLLQTLSCCFCKCDHQPGHALCQLSCFLNNHKQLAKTSPCSIFMSFLLRSHTRSWLLTSYRGGEVFWLFNFSPPTL